MPMTITVRAGPSVLNALNRCSQNPSATVATMMNRSAPSEEKIVFGIMYLSAGSRLKINIDAKARFVGQGVDAAVHGKTTGHAHLGVHGVHKAVAVRLSDVLLGSDQTHTGGNGYLGLQHAAHHALYMVRLGNGVDLFRRVQAAALHQLDVDD